MAARALRPRDRGRGAGRAAGDDRDRGRAGRVGRPADGSGFVVGRVETREPHPNADRLSVCTVDTGDSEPRTIVCGAPNVDAGQTVAVALPGATMPGGIELGEAKLRGVTSSGMILSAAELEIGEDADGIMVLDDGPEPGTPLSEALPLAEQVLELEVTPNRPDCLGVYGVAREVHAVTAAPLGPAPWEEDPHADGDGKAEDHASVTVEVPALCPRFTARVFTDVKIGPSPPWLQARLTAAGQRPINNVVDITNYVMLLTSQPLHAFDLDRVPDGDLIIRTASEGETMTTLDGVEREFDAETVLVCDRDGPSGIAGIMGGQVSEVVRGDDPGAARGRQLERNQHPPHLAQARPPLGGVGAVRERAPPGALHAGAARSPRGCSSSSAARSWCRGRLTSPPRSRRTITSACARRESRSCSGWRWRRPTRSPTSSGSDSTSTPPTASSWSRSRADRHSDVTREVDLIEEIGRIHGLDEHLPSTLPTGWARSAG